MLEKLKRLAEKNKLSHAYLFFGPKDAPKEELALELIKHLDPNQTDTLQYSEVEPPNIGIEEVRAIRKFLYQTTTNAKKRICIIQKAERLTWQAMPALLKLVEEPPAHSLLIFTTHDAQVLSPALLSRLIKIYIRPQHIAPAKAGKTGLTGAREGSQPTLAEEIEKKILDLYTKDKIKNTRAISFLLEKLEAATRFNLNPKLQRKAIEAII